MDPAAAQRARAQYACFDRYGEEPQAYGYAATINVSRSCEDEAVRQLLELRQHRAAYLARDGRPAADDLFSAEQNARVVRSAEAYYRSMFRGRAESWNLRDRHMMWTLEELLAHERGAGRAAKAVVWAHNSHLGDARATSMAAGGELNLGQLAREHFGAAACLIGMTTHRGSVTAAREWEQPAEHRQVRPSLEGSYERVFHDTGVPMFLLRLHDRPLVTALARARLERAIGVIYKPETERGSHYFSARLPDQFDVVIHVDSTRALEPLEAWARHEADLPETYPTGV